MTIWARLLQIRLFIIAAIGVLVGVTILFLRNAGYLESFDLKVYDWALGVRSVATSPDPRVVLVEITEEEITNPDYGYPIKDDVLARALEILTRAKPSAIGIDLYRDFPMPPGTDRLKRAFRENNRIVIVKKFGSGASDQIPPPPFVTNPDQVGFSDFPLDPDRRIRRAYLYLWSEDGSPSFSLSYLLALRYLNDEGILPSQADPNHPGWTQLGKVILKPLKRTDGGYAQADDGGYAYLLDYKQALAPFWSFRLSELLKQQVPPGKLENRVILIGTTATSVHDNILTPYSESTGSIRGLELHAHAVSQLLRMALDGAAPMRLLGDRAESWLILVYALVGSVAAAVARSGIRIAIHALVLPFAFAGPIAIAIRWDFWIPAFGPALAWCSSIAAVGLYTASIERWLVRRARTPFLEGALGLQDAERPKVFISYSSKDRARVNQICAAVEAAGIRCWIDYRDNWPGEFWAEGIIRSLECCSIMLLLLSSHSNNSRQVRKEVDRADAKGLTLLPIRLEDVTLSGVLEFHLAETHWLDAFKGPFEENLERIVASVRKHLSELKGGKRSGDTA